MSCEGSFIVAKVWSLANLLVVLLLQYRFIVSMTQWLMLNFVNQPIKAGVIVIPCIIRVATVGIIACVCSIA